MDFWKWLFKFMLERLAAPTVDGPSVGTSFEIGGASMKTATLQRLEVDDDGTFGKLTLDDGRTLCSGELPWKNNAPGESCIPPGSYGCSWAFSHKLGRNCYHLRGVRDRADILIHPANFVGDRSAGKKCEVQGCIALGMSVGAANGQKMLQNSRDALYVLEEWGDQEPFTLTIL